MPVDKPTLVKLKKFIKVFADARERDANESDTVMYLIEFFKEVLGYDPLGGEISKEVSICDRYCDFGIRLDDKLAFLVEAKAAGTKTLKPKHIEQAENYASRAAINWVVLTNGIDWQLYHLTFGNGIEHELVFEVNLLEDIEQKPDWTWDILSVLGKRNLRDDSLAMYYQQQKLLSAKNVVNMLLGEEMLMKLRQELNRKASIRLDLTAVFEAVRDVLSQEALASAGDIVAPSKRKHKRRQRKNEDQVETEAGDVQEPKACTEVNAAQSAPLSLVQPLAAALRDKPAAPPPAVN